MENIIFFSISLNSEFLKFKNYKSHTGGLLQIINNINNNNNKININNNNNIVSCIVLFIFFIYGYQTLNIILYIEYTKMEKFVDVLKSINLDQVKLEVEPLRIKNSRIINNILAKAYPEYKTTLSKHFLKNIWENLINNTDNEDINIWIQVFTHISNILKVLYTNEHSLLCAFSEFRPPVKKKYPDNKQIMSATYIGYDYDVVNKRRQAYKNKVHKRNMERGKLPELEVSDVLDKINILKTSKCIYEKALSVLLSTGVRSIELFKVTQFIPCEDKKYIKLLGIAKNESKKNDIFQRPLVGMTCDEVIDIVYEVRNNLDVSGKNKNISARLNPYLNYAFKKHFPDIGSSHKSRYIYSNAAHALNAGLIPFESYLQMILGHSNADTTKSYLGINLKNSIPEGVETVSKDVYLKKLDEVKELRRQIEELKLILEKKK
jgi:integrase